MARLGAKHLPLVAVVVALSSVIAVAQQSSAQRAPITSEEQSLTGTVTCAGRITHQYTCQRNQTQQTCTLDCVQRGSEFVLMVGDKPYTLDVDWRNVQSFAGGNATVAGVLAGDRLHVRTVSNAKLKSASYAAGE